MRMKKMLVPMAALLTTAAVSPFEDTTKLDRKVAQYLGADIGDYGGARAPIDPKLKLGRCPSGITITDARRNAVQVSCRKLGWRIYVPLTEGGGNAGWRAGSRSGEYTVQRNQPLLLTIRRPNFVVSYSVVAQKNGYVGDFIPVRADRKSKVLMARITNSGEVELAK